jgi:hypothetical protein
MGSLWKLWSEEFLRGKNPGRTMDVVRVIIKFIKDEGKAQQKEAVIPSRWDRGGQKKEWSFVSRDFHNSQRQAAEKIGVIFIGWVMRVINKFV